MRIAGFEQRLVVGLAVVGDQDVELRSRCSVSDAEQAGFLAEIAHEELAHAKALGRDAAHADQKCVGAGAAGEAGGLGVEKRPARGGAGRRFAARKRASSRSSGKLG